MGYNIVANEPKELAYDLRQIYARLLGDHLIDAANHRKAKQFYEWYKSLEDIKTITYHKFKDKEKVLKEYAKLIKKVERLSNKYKTTWTGQHSDPVGFGEIDAILRELEEFLYVEMEKGKIFGEGYRIAGL